MPCGVQFHAGGIVSTVAVFCVKCLVGLGVSNALWGSVTCRRNSVYSSSMLRCVKFLVGFSSMQGE